MDNINKDNMYIKIAITVFVAWAIVFYMAWVS